MLRRITLLLALQCMCLCVFAQVPQAIPYQAMLRHSDGTVMASEEVTVQIDLLEGLPTGAAVYSEQQTVTTSALGLISIAIGGEKAKVISGTFAEIPWHKELYLKVMIKRAGGEFVTMDPVQVLAVPVALRAQSAHRADTTDKVLNAARAKQFAGGVWKIEQGNSSQTKGAPAHSIFEVKNTKGQLVFAVYDGAIRANVGKGGFVVQEQGTQNTSLVVTPDSTGVFFNQSPGTKGVRTGFAVGTRSGHKGPGTHYLAVSPQSTEINFDASPTKGVRTGFAVGTRSGRKDGSTDYLRVLPGLVEITYDATSAKGVRTGFAVGTRSGHKGPAADLLAVSDDGVQVTFDDSHNSKSVRTGFAVGTRSGHKAKGPYDRPGVNYLSVTSDSTTIISRTQPNAGTDANQPRPMTFDVGGLNQQNPEYQSYFAVNEEVTTVGNLVVDSTHELVTRGVLVPNYTTDMVADGSGNWYKTVRIGNDLWFRSNLRAAHYSDGRPIKNSQGQQYKTALEVFENSRFFSLHPELSPDTFGYYYSLQQVKGLLQEDKGNICPIGWHVADKADWASAIETIREAAKNEFPNVSNIDSIVSEYLSLPGYWSSTYAITPRNNSGMSIPAAGFLGTELKDSMVLACYWLGDIDNDTTRYFSMNASGKIAIEKTDNGTVVSSDYMPVRCVKGYKIDTVVFASVEKETVKYYYQPRRSMQEGHTYRLSSRIVYPGKRPFDKTGFKVWTEGITDTTYYFDPNPSSRTISVVVDKINHQRPQGDWMVYCSPFVIIGEDTLLRKGDPPLFTPKDPTAPVTAAPPQLVDFNLQQAVLRSKVLDWGGFPVTRRGFVVWQDIRRGQQTQTQEDTIWVDDNFELTIEPLQPNTFYRVWAIAENQFGTEPIRTDSMEFCTGFEAPYPSFILDPPQLERDTLKFEPLYTSTYDPQTVPQPTCFPITRYGLKYWEANNPQPKFTNDVRDTIYFEYQPTFFFTLDANKPNLESGVLLKGAAYCFVPYCETQFGMFYGDTLRYTVPMPPKITMVTDEHALGNTLIIAKIDGDPREVEVDFDLPGYQDIEMDAFMVDSTLLWCGMIEEKEIIKGDTTLSVTITATNNGGSSEQSHNVSYTTQELGVTVDSVVESSETKTYHSIYISLQNADCVELQQLQAFGFDAKPDSVNAEPRDLTSALTQQAFMKVSVDGTQHFYPTRLFVNTSFYNQQQKPVDVQYVTVKCTFRRFDDPNNMNPIEVWCEDACRVTSAASPSSKND